MIWYLIIDDIMKAATHEDKSGHMLKEERDISEERLQLTAGDVNRFLSNSERREKTSELWRKERQLMKKYIGGTYSLGWNISNRIIKKYINFTDDKCLNVSDDNLKTLLDCVNAKSQEEFIAVMEICKEKNKIGRWRDRGVGDFRDANGTRNKVVLVKSNAEMFTTVKERKGNMKKHSNQNIKLEHNVSEESVWRESVPEEGYKNFLTEFRRNYRSPPEDGKAIVSVRFCNTQEWDFDHRYTYCTYLIMFCRGYQPDLFKVYRKSHTYLYILTKKMGSMIVCCEPGFETEITKVLNIFGIQIWDRIKLNIPDHTIVDIEEEETTLMMPVDGSFDLFPMQLSYERSILDRMEVTSLDITKGINYTDIAKRDIEIESKARKLRELTNDESETLSRIKNNNERRDLRTQLEQCGPEWSVYWEEDECFLMKNLGETQLVYEHGEHYNIQLYKLANSKTALRINSRFLLCTKVNFPKIKAFLPGLPYLAWVEAIVDFESVDKESDMLAATIMTRLSAYSKAMSTEEIKLGLAQEEIGILTSTVQHANKGGTTDCDRYLRSESWRREFESLFGNTNMSHFMNCSCYINTEDRRKWNNSMSVTMRAVNSLKDEELKNKAKLCLKKIIFMMNSCTPSNMVKTTSSIRTYIEAAFDEVNGRIADDEISEEEMFAGLTFSSTKSKTVSKVVSQKGSKRYFERTEATKTKYKQKDSESESDSSSSDSDHSSSDDEKSSYKSCDDSP
jgi:hypothetical protein